MRSDGAPATQKPDPGRAEICIPDAVRTFLEACADHRLYALFYLAVTTGLRRGEILGLKWTDLDCGTGTLRIQRQLRWAKGQSLQLRELKTAAA